MLHTLGGKDQKKWLTGLTILSLTLGIIVALRQLTNLRSQEEETALKLDDLDDRLTALEQE